MLRRSILSNTVGIHAKRNLSAAAAAAAHTATKKDKLVIFDTTLRDGEQAPGASLNTKDKLIIARQLSKLGVDVCEAGFPIASPGDFEAVKQIAIEIGPLKEGRLSGKPMTICGLARSVEQDIQRAYDAIKYAPSHRIHTFLATSDIHLQYKLKISREKCIEQAVRAVRFAKERTPDVEFSAEDAGRSDPAFLAEIFSEVIKAGATTLNIPDTVGFVTPQEYGALIKYLVEHTKGVENVVLSTHCHNDLGLAVANTLAGISNGARQVEVTVNGIGERAGNSSLEEVVMALHTRPHLFPVACSIDTTQIMRSSKMVSQLTGIVVQPNKAIVGANAFAHESGIHQDGVLKHQATYEIMRPETVGIVSTLVMGKHSGKHAFMSRLKELGYGEVAEDKEKVAKMFAQFKRVADAKKTCTDADIEAIISDELSQPEELWKLNSVTVVAGISHPTATVSLTTPSGEVVQDAALGSGPIGAIYKAISRVIGVNIKLVDFHVEAVTEGQNSLGHVSVRIKNMDEEVATAESGEDFDDVSYGGHSADIDTMVASARAFVGSINQMLSARKTRKRLQPPGRVTRHPREQVPLP